MDCSSGAPSPTTALDSPWPSSGSRRSPSTFRTLSGWRNDRGDAATGSETTAGGQTYVKAANGDWWYHEDALFVTGYADSSPTEDFCETVAAVIMGSAFPFGSDPTAPVAKRAWIHAWLNNV